MSHHQTAEPKVELTSIECRVVGALIEKSFTTPDVYPMTTNALVSACNQKTNRDPVVAYDARTVDAALLDLRQRNLVRKVHTPGARATKHRQTIDELLGLDPASTALLSVLLLRGPQTVGELRLRTERHEVCDDIEAVEACLEQLAAREIPLVQRIGRQPGQKEDRWQHLLGDDDEAVAAPVPNVTYSENRAHSPSAHAPQAAPRPSTTPVPTGLRTAEREVAEPRTAERELAEPRTAEREVAEPRTAEREVAEPGVAEREVAERVASLESEVADLRARLRRLAEALGEPLD